MCILSVCNPLTSSNKILNLLISLCNLFIFFVNEIIYKNVTIWKFITEKWCFPVTLIATLIPFPRRLFSLPLMFIFLSSIPMLLFLDFSIVDITCCFLLWKMRILLYILLTPTLALLPLPHYVYVKLLFNNQWLHYYGSGLIVS